MKKRILSLLLAVVMTLSLASPAVAAEEFVAEADEAREEMAPAPAAPEDPVPAETEAEAEAAEPAPPAEEEPAPAPIPAEDEPMAASAEEDIPVSIAEDTNPVSLTVDGSGAGGDSTSFDTLANAIQSVEGSSATSVAINVTSGYSGGEELTWDKAVPLYIYTNDESGASIGAVTVSSAAGVYLGKSVPEKDGTGVLTVASVTVSEALSSDVKVYCNGQVAVTGALTVNEGGSAELSGGTYGSITGSGITDVTNLLKADDGDKYCFADSQQYRIENPTIGTEGNLKNVSVMLQREVKAPTKTQLEVTYGSGTSFVMSENGSITVKYALTSNKTEPKTEDEWVDGLKADTSHNAGTYYILWKVEPTGEYAGEKGVLEDTIEIKPAALTISSWDPGVGGSTEESGTIKYTYSNTAHQPTHVLSGIVEGDDEGDVVKVTVTKKGGSETVEEPKDVGSYTATAEKLEGGKADNYTLTGDNLTKDFEITPGTATVDTEPQPLNRVYDGEASDLVTAGKVTNGKMQYKLSTEDKYEDAVPKNTTDGNVTKSYTVEWQATADANYAFDDGNTTKTGSVTVTITKAVAKTTKEYFATLNDALDPSKLSEGDKTVTLLENVEEEVVYRHSTNPTLQADSLKTVKKLTLEASGSLTVGQNVNITELILKGNSGVGTPTVTVNGATLEAVADETATLKVENGTVTLTSGTVKVTSGSITVNGVSYTAGEGGMTLKYEGDTLTLVNGSVKLSGETAAVKVGEIEIGGMTVSGKTMTVTTTDGATATVDADASIQAFTVGEKTYSTPEDKTATLDVGTDGSVTLTKGAVKVTTSPVKVTNDGVTYTVSTESGTVTVTAGDTPTVETETGGSVTVAEESQDGTSYTAAAGSTLTLALTEDGPAVQSGKLTLAQKEESVRVMTDTSASWPVTNEGTGVVTVGVSGVNGKVDILAGGGASIGAVTVTAPQAVTAMVDASGNVSVTLQPGESVTIGSKTFKATSEETVKVDQNGKVVLPVTNATIIVGADAKNVFIGNGETVSVDGKNITLTGDGAGTYVDITDGVVTVKGATEKNGTGTYLNAVEGSALALTLDDKTVTLTEGTVQVDSGAALTVNGNIYTAADSMTLDYNDGETPTLTAGAVTLGAGAIRVYGDRIIENIRDRAG